MPVTANDPITLSLAAAIGLQEGYNVAGSRPARNNNPGDIKVTSSGSNNPNNYPVDDQGHIIYPTSTDGFNALQSQTAHILNQNSNTYCGNPETVTLADVGSQYAADPNWANGVAKALGIPNPPGAAVTMQQLTSGVVPVKAASDILPANKLATTGSVPGQQTGATGSTQGTNSNGALVGDNPTNATTPTGQDITDADYAAMYSTNLEITSGMSEIPWYNDASLITGNKRVRQSVQPVVFQVYLSQLTGEMLTNPNTGEVTTLQLNCSMNDFAVQSKHVFNKQQTRTGHHVTFWGMQPDLITGSASTGVFMNQYGLTDYFSIADVPDDVFQQVQEAFINQQTGQQRPSTSSSNVTNQSLINNPEALRIAAQDCFTEFLKLFQMNGVVWYQGNNTRTDGAFDSTSQYSPTAWVPSQGTTSFQRNSRANDVLTKGYVVMKYRNSTYLGYFKSLSWAVDAEKPFSWNFNFVFQVERTLSSYYFPFTGTF